MTTPLLRTALEPLVERHRRLRLLAGLAVAFAILGLSGWLLVSAKMVLFLAALIAAWFIYQYTSNWQPDYALLAREIELKHPHLQHLLQTAVEQEPHGETGRLGYLQLRVVADAVGACRNGQILEDVSKRRLAGAWVAFAASAALLLGTFTVKSKVDASPVAKRVAADVPSIEVTPGDIVLERGSGLVVLAKFPLADAPTEASLVVQKANQPTERTSMMKNFEDPVFGGGLPEVNTDLLYRVEYAGKATRDFKVQVYEHPRLERADAHLRFPEYTKLPVKEIPDTRRVSAVEGTKLDVEFHLNKPVKRAALVGKDQPEIPLTFETSEPLARLKDFSIEKSGTYEVQLEDADGRKTKVPVHFSIEAKPNRMPQLKFLAPRGDIRVSPLEEVAFRIEAWDDFGLIKVGLHYTVGGRGEAKEFVIAENSAADGKIITEHLLKLEELKLPADELISWYAWAEDIGPDGKVRRTGSDMYFAEVRPFEEIFRQGDSAEGEQQQPQNQQSAEGRQAAQLAQLQKQIITASWNLLRAETTDHPSEKYLKDEPVVRDSQKDALEQATQLTERLEDPKSRGFADTATQEMQTAIELLTAAATTTTPMRDAIQAEQAAYNALLKLASHEYNVTRRQQQRNQGQQSSPGMQQQLDELELKPDEKRYEAQREAGSPEEEAQREQLAVLNRLKELARRQDDINEKVKELQAALQEEKTEKEKEELRRELKRLREEQQQMLANMDELKEKMEQPQNEARFSEERQKLEQARSEAQQASEAMQRGEASQALASGARTQRELQEMRDEMRRKTSKQFSEEMRNMRSDARELADRQKEVGEKLTAAASKPERKTLDGSSDSEKTAQDLVKQKEALQKLTEDMKRVSEQAETSEPLLATELYDTLRKSAQSDTARSLDMTQQLAQRGYTQDAQKFEEKARGEIEDIKQGVERAAEKVLGDEAEALRKARADLDRLAQQLDQEIQKKTGERPSDSGEGEDAGTAQAGQQGNPSGSQSPRGQAGRRPAGENDPAQNRLAQNRNGENQTGRQQPQPDERETQGTQGAEGTGQEPKGEPRPGEGRGEERARQPGQNGEATERTAQQRQQQPGRGDRLGDQPGAQNGERPAEEAGENQSGNQSGEQPGSRTAQGNRQGQRGEQPGGQSGEQGSGLDNSQANQSGDRAGNQRSPSSDGDPRNTSDGNERGNDRRGLAEIATESRERRGERRTGGGNGAPWGGGAEDTEQAGPLTGEKFVEWSDQLRSVEEMLDDADLRADAARIREVARGMRAEFKRHSVEPKWDIVRSEIRAPLAELRNRVTEELARREKKDVLVPIDRDPVPVKFTEQVRKYYEELGRSSR